VSLFKQRKNKRFSYTPRHLREKDSHIKENLESKWRETRQTSKHQGKASLNLLVWLLVLGMIIVLWYVLDNYKS
jgi:hypothetical protein